MLNLAHVASRFALGLIAFTAPACTFTLPFQATAEEDLKIAVQDAKTLRCKTHNGFVRVRHAAAKSTQADSGFVQVHAKKVARGTTQAAADASLAAIEVSHEIVDGELHLGWRWQVEKSHNWSGAVSFTVDLPGGLGAKLVTHNGAITVQGLAELVDARTHNGAITVDASSSRVALRTHNGAISLRGVAKDVALHTHNGAIRVELDGEGAVSGSIRTHNGAIAVEVGAGRSAQFGVKVHNGRIHLDGVQVQHRSKRERRGQLGGEAASSESDPLELRSHNGSISLRSKRG